jgi:anti-anti-sigma factor
VTCTLKRIGNGRYALAVGDEGPGIDPCRLAPARPDDASSERSRGMGIVHTYSDAVELTPDSTRITATVTLTRPTTFATVDQDDATVMTPSGDITAVVAEEFRRALLLWVEKSQTHLTLDLRNVNNIDSVSLSVLVVLGRMVKSKELTRRVRVVNAGRDVTNLFLLTRMNRLFEVVQLTREQTGGVTAYGSLYP